jgi:ABC-type transporter Mla MlaB component
MEDEFNLSLTREEAIKMDEQIEQMLAAMRKANEQMARDQIEIERLKTETWALLADLQRMLGGSNVETILRTV